MHVLPDRSTHEKFKVNIVNSTLQFVPFQALARHRTRQLVQGDRVSCRRAENSCRIVYILSGGAIDERAHSTSGAHLLRRFVLGQLLS